MGSSVMVDGAMDGSGVVGEDDTGAGLGGDVTGACVGAPVIGSRVGDSVGRGVGSTVIGARVGDSVGRGAIVAGAKQPCGWILNSFWEYGENPEEPSLMIGSITHFTVFKATPPEFVLVS